MSSDRELIAKDWTGRLWLYETLRKQWGAEIERAFTPRRTAEGNRETPPPISPEKGP